MFSKDRPLQLDATLRSLELNCEDLELAQIRVLFKTSAPRYASGYRVLASEHPTVAMHREVDFKPDLVSMAGGSEYLLFLVDDTLFVGGLSLASPIRVLERGPSCVGFSYRLGRNTTYCYTLDQPQRLPPFEELGSGLLAFDWTDAEYDFGYPVEVSSSLYRTSDVLPLLRQLEYRNPNTLESALAQHADSFRETHPRLACYGRSVALSVPANLVQTAWKNRIDSNPALTAEALADAYARGQRLDVERYRGFVANACHQELDLHFVQDHTVPAVTIVIPCYGQAGFLAEAVQSVVGQTFGDWEIVIVDDGSPDETAAVAKELIEQHAGQRIRLLTLENGGLARARNAGIVASKGRYVLPLDADDQIAPTMLERTVQLLETHPDVAIAYTDLQQFGDASELVRADDFHTWGLPDANQLSYCSLYRREAWEAAGGYNPNMIHGYEDWDFWLSCVERGYVARRIPEPLFLYRIRTGTMFSVALAHNRELRRQMRANHPVLYAWRRRFSRRLLRAARRVARRAGRALRAARA